MYWIILKLSEKYTRAQIAIAEALGFEVIIVDSLPEVGQNRKLYFVPKSVPGEEDFYDEYIWVANRNKYEKVGHTDVDLSQYATKEYVDERMPEIPENDGNYVMNVEDGISTWKEANEWESL